MKEKAGHLQPIIRDGYCLTKEISERHIERYVVCAAVRYGNTVIASARHFDPLMTDIVGTLKEKGVIGTIPDSQGFIDQFGCFMNRKEALAIATYQNQINVRRPKTFPAHELFSEDLY